MQSILFIDISKGSGFFVLLLFVFIYFVVGCVAVMSS